MSVKRECENCGEMFKLQTGNEFFCLPCELAIKAMEPPGHLKDMRWVYEGKEPQTASQQAMKKLMEESTAGFLDRLSRFDDQYRQAVAKQMPQKKVVEAPSWDGKGECPTCKRGSQVLDADTEACVRKATEWLVQRKKAEESNAAGGETQQV